MQIHLLDPPKFKAEDYISTARQDDNSRIREEKTSLPNELLLAEIYHPIQQPIPETQAPADL